MRWVATYPKMVMDMWGKWFPDLPASTKRGVELLYGGGAYTRERMIPHTMMHYMAFERLFVARIGLSIARHVEMAALLAAGGTTAAEVLEGLAMHIDEANAIQLQRTDGDEAKATVYEIKMPGSIADADDDGLSEESARIDQRLGFAAQTSADSGELNKIVITEKINGKKVSQHSIDDFDSILHILRAEASLLGTATTKISGALEAFMAVEDTEGAFSFSDVAEAAKPALKSLTLASEKASANALVGLRNLTTLTSLTLELGDDGDWDYYAENPLPPQVTDDVMRSLACLVHLEKIV